MGGGRLLSAVELSRRFKVTGDSSEAEHPPALPFRTVSIYLPLESTTCQRIDIGGRKSSDEELWRQFEVVCDLSEVRLSPPPVAALLPPHRQTLSLKDSVDGFFSSSQQGTATTTHENQVGHDELDLAWTSSHFISPIGDLRLESQSSPSSSTR